jgi:hypothetical protein
MANYIKKSVQVGIQCVADFRVGKRVKGLWDVVSASVYE